MKRPWGWPRWLLLSAALAVAVEFALLTVIAPRHLLAALQRLVGGDLTVRQARLALPLTTVLTDLRYQVGAPQAALSARQVVIKPRWLPSGSGAVQIQSIRVMEPYLRLSRTAEGTLFGPHPAMPRPLAALREKALRVRIERLSIVDGTIEWIDESLPTPVHLVLEHLSLELGPLTLPATGEALSAALRAAVVGPAGDPAPLYCSGWWARAGRNLDVSCHLDPISLAIFEPYFQRRPVLRFYGTTLMAETRWNALGNRLLGRVQFELDRFSEGDISVRGRTILRMAQLAGGEPAPKLRGEFSFRGPLDDRAQWEGRFTPGNESAQRLVEQLLERQIKGVTLPVGPQGLRVQLPQGASEDPVDDAGLTKEINEALELIAGSEMPAPAPVAP